MEGRAKAQLVGAGVRAERERQRARNHHHGDEEIGDGTGSDAHPLYIGADRWPLDLVALVLGIAVGVAAALVLLWAFYELVASP